MRIPDYLKECVCFLTVKSTEGGIERRLYGGTAFFVAVPSEVDPDAHYAYLVTAKHCVERAKKYSNIFVRLNTVVGGYDFVEHHGEWFTPDNEAIDIAVSEFNPPLDVFIHRGVPQSMFMTPEVATKYGIGIGDDICSVGLFTERYGTQKNIPIARSGIIAAMPEEPLRDDNTGLLFDAYLAEVRSIGGLSGSPVFVRKEVWGEEKTPNLGLPLPEERLFLLGAVRGHWDYKQPALEDFSVQGELATVNKGIATVTPATEILSLLNEGELMKNRKQADREFAEKSRETLDSDFGSKQQDQDRPFSKESFENALKKASSKVSAPESGKTRTSE